VRRQTQVLLILLTLPIIIVACSLFGGANDEDTDSSVGLVTATPGTQTAVAAGSDSDRQPTATGTPTPTLHPAFPTPALTETWIAEQEFENGWAFAIQDRTEIWVAIFTDERGGDWTIYEDEFFLETERTGQEPTVEYGETPPEDKVMPVRGFGLLWVSNEEVRQGLGWGVWIELGQDSTLRYDAGGLINTEGEYVPRAGRYTLTNIGNDVFVFDEETSTFTWEPSSP